MKRSCLFLAVFSVFSGEVLAYPYQERNPNPTAAVSYQAQNPRQGQLTVSPFTMLYLPQEGTTTDKFFVSLDLMKGGSVDVSSHSHINGNIDGAKGLGVEFGKIFTLNRMFDTAVGFGVSKYKYSGDKEHYHYFSNGVSYGNTYTTIKDLSSMDLSISGYLFFNGLGKRFVPYIGGTVDFFKLSRKFKVNNQSSIYRHDGHEGLVHVGSHYDPVWEDGYFVGLEEIKEYEHGWVDTSYWDNSEFSKEFKEETQLDFTFRLRLGVKTYVAQDLSLGFEFARSLGKSKFGEDSHGEELKLKAKGNEFHLKVSKEF